MINLHESMGPGRDRTRDPWICSQTRICSQTHYRLRYAARYGFCICIDSALMGQSTPTTAFAELIQYFIYTMLKN